MVVVALYGRYLYNTYYISCLIYNILIVLRRYRVIEESYPPTCRRNKSLSQVKLGENIHKAYIMSFYHLFGGNYSLYPLCEVCTVDSTESLHHTTGCRPGPELINIVVNYFPGSYTFSVPCNCFCLSPLLALIVFETSEERSIHIDKNHLFQVYIFQDYTRCKYTRLQEISEFRIMS